MHVPHELCHCKLPSLLMYFCNESKSDQVRHTAACDCKPGRILLSICPPPFSHRALTSITWVSLNMRVPHIPPKREIRFLGPRASYHASRDFNSECSRTRLGAKRVVAALVIVAVMDSSGTTHPRELVLQFRRKRY